MIKIRLEDLIADLQRYLFQRRYVFYNIRTKTQIPDFLQSEYMQGLHDLLRELTYSKFYDNYAFVVENEFNSKLVKLCFATIFLDYLESEDIDISTPELIVNDDVNIEHYEVVYKWLNLNPEKFRAKALEQDLF